MKISEMQKFIRTAKTKVNNNPAPLSYPLPSLWPSVVLLGSVAGFAIGEGGCGAGAGTSGIIGGGGGSSNTSSGW